MFIFIRQLLKLYYKKLIFKKATRSRDYLIASLVDEKFLVDYFNNLKFSKSQLRQDLFVLSELEFKENGFFIEFGAGNGVDCNNTFLLETKFKWKGILSEPAKIFQSELRKNRSSAIETDCVWSKTGETLLFNEVNDKQHFGMLSTIDKFSHLDSHAKLRDSANSNKYYAKTISLADMLKKHNAPKEIDFLSIDTEGSEFEILNSFNFDEYDIKIITCEHNYTPNREKIHNLLIKNGYKNIHRNYSLFDDWYIKR